MDLVRVTRAGYLGGYRVRLHFSDGIEGDVDLADELWGEVFQPLRDPEFFAPFAVEETLVWPNGADFAPEYLYARITRGAPSAG